MTSSPENWRVLARLLFILPLLLLLNLMPTAQAETNLVSGKTISASVAKGNWNFYQITSQATSASLTVKLTGLSNDADLYVRQGSQPSQTKYNCRPLKRNKTSESCLITLPAKATTLFVGVFGYAAASYKLNATLKPTDDHGDIRTRATVAKVNTTVTGSISPVRDIDFFKMAVPGAGTLVAESQDTTDTYGQLYDAAGKVLAKNDDGNSGKNFSITYKTTQAGVYYVSVRHSKASGTGAYALKITFTATGSNTPAVILPFTSGQTWRVCQGYNTPEISHFGSLAHSFDLSIADNSVTSGAYGCTGSATTSAGQNLRAPASGKIAWISPLTSDIVCLTLDKPAANNARSLMLGHITVANGIKMGSVVAKDAVLGKVNLPNNDNGRYAHIHISAFKTTQCMDSIGVISDSIAFDKMFGGNYNFTSNGSKHQWYGSRVSK